MKQAQHKTLVQFFTIVSLIYATQLSAQPFKILHMTYHMGCLKEIERVAKELRLDITPWFILKNRVDFDGETTTNALYNMGHDRAEKVWQRHKDTFNQYDAILISDTAPLARIFLQHNWKKPLIIWVCNRFDYYDEATNDCDFPDNEYGEFYCPENRDCFVYFDSWQDLADKIKITNYQSKKTIILNFAKNHRAIMLSRWQELFDEIHFRQRMADFNKKIPLDNS